MKYHLTEHREKITDVEIEMFKDFEDLLAKEKEYAGGGGYNQPFTSWRLLSAVVILAVLGITYYMVKPEAEISPIPPGDMNGSKQEAYDGPVERKEITSGKVPEKESLPSAVPDGSERLEQNGDIGQTDNTNRKERISEDKATDDPSVTETPGADKEYVYSNAEPLAGFKDLYEYFNNELKYPAEALKDSIEGTVIVSFAIATTGEITDIKIESSIGALFDVEAERLIRNMPEWRPATVNDRPVWSKMSIPLHFQIKRSER